MRPVQRVSEFRNVRVLFHIWGQASRKTGPCLIRCNDGDSIEHQCDGFNKHMAKNCK